MTFQPYDSPSHFKATRQTSEIIELIPLPTEFPSNKLLCELESVDSDENVYLGPNISGGQSWHGLRIRSTAVAGRQMLTAQGRQAMSGITDRSLALPLQDDSATLSHLGPSRDSSRRVPAGSLHLLQTKKKKNQTADWRRRARGCILCP